MKKVIINQLSAISVIFFLFISLIGSAQSVEFDKKNFPNDPSGLKEAKRDIEKADDYFLQSKNEGFQLYGQALPLYLKVDSFNSKNAMINYKIGVCYLHSAFKNKAFSYLEKAVQLNPNVDIDVHDYLGQAYQLNMEWDKAIKEYKKASQKLNAPENKDEKKKVEKEIIECKNGIELIKKPVDVTIENVGAEINSPYPDYGPVISADESVMMFTSRRANTTGGQIDPANQKYFEDIYISTFEDGKWSEAKNMGKPVNSDNHDAIVALSADGQKLFIYEGSDGKGDIYQCQLRGDSWSSPETMGDPINSPKFHESSASISADGNTFYFVSNREGGLGGHDIYKCNWDKKKNKWGPAENLGATINTPYEEYSVFIHPDGKTLYFSSEGHNTMGGFDIFKSVWDAKRKKWSKPENLGYPINTPDDDVNFVVAASGKHAYYSSFRADGYGEKDIYMVTFAKGEPPKAEVTILKGTITDCSTKEKIEADIELVDNQLNQVIATFKSNSSTGKYLVSLPSGKNYGIAVKKDGYLFHSENVDIPDSAAFKEIIKDICLENLSVGNKIILKNIFFDFDKATLRPESTAELERLSKLLTDNPSMVIEISGHTDNKGTDEYNNKLSQSRSQSVVDYLVSHGISKNRLTAKGYGETQPIASNDTDEGRQLNRRTEFKILSK